MAVLRSANGIDRSGSYSENVGDCVETSTKSQDSQRNNGNIQILGIEVAANGHAAAARPQRAFKIRSPLAVGKVLLCKDALLTIWVQSSYYAAGYCIQASIPATYKSAPYSFSELQVGLAYIPGAVGVIISFYTTSTFIDRNYKSKAGKIGFTVDKVKGDDLAKFPIEEVRFRWAGILNTLCLCAMVGYGWSIDRHVHVAVPLILQFLFSFWSNWLIQASSILLVDVFPETPSIAATAGNMSRCVMAAIWHRSAATSHWFDG